VNAPGSVSTGPQDAFSWADDARWLTAVLALAGLLRVVRWNLFAVIFNDGPVYIALARALTEGDVSSALLHPIHPLYPALIAGAWGMLSPLGLSWEVVGGIVSISMGTAAVAALYAFVRSTFDGRTALLAALLFALHPAAIDNSANIQTEGLYLLLFFAGSAALYCALRDADLRWAAVAGLCSGLAYLTRPEGIAIVIVAGLFGLWRLAARRWRPLRALAWLAVLGIAAASCVLPYVGALYAETGEIWLTRKKSISWVFGIEGPPEHFQREPEPERTEPRVVMPGQMEKIAETGPIEHPPTTLERVMAALGDLSLTAVRSYRYELLLFSLVGIGACFGVPALRGRLIFALIAIFALVLFGLSYNVGYVSKRHTLPPMCLLLGYAAVGAPLVGRALLRPFGARLSAQPVAALLVALAIVLVLDLGKVLRYDGLENVAERRAGEWLSAQPRGEGAVAARKQRVAYYADAPFVKLRSKGPTRFVDYLDRESVRHVIVKEQDVELYDGLAETIDARMVLVHTEDVHGIRALVYEYDAGGDR